ncbi:MAG: hypothetical protein Q9227_008080 [Pyrenula ochraceoflavens]
MAVERPPYRRNSSRLPGGFDTDTDDDEHLFAPNDSSQGTHGQTPGGTSILPPASNDESSLLPAHPTDSSPLRQNENTYLEEQEMNKKLMAQDESSFVPELSHLASNQRQPAGADDTYVFGMPNDNLAVRKRPAPIDVLSSSNNAAPHSSDLSSSPQTPPGAYKTPAPEEQSHRLGQTQEAELHTPEPQNTSSLETMSSSPTTAAAARTVSRVISMATAGPSESTATRDGAKSPTRSLHNDDSAELDFTPRKNQDQYSSSRPSSPTPALGDLGSPPDFRSQWEDAALDRRSTRPKYLQSRQSQQRLSRTSVTSSNTDTTSNATIGADYALQSGGAAPATRSSKRLPKELSRTESLGSMISGLSDMSDEDAQFGRRANMTPGLETLDEYRPLSRVKSETEDAPITPKASNPDLTIPTDTVIANNVRDIEVPGTFARQYRQNHRSVSPEKTQITATPGTVRAGKSMTLKEHRSTVDRLGKENFDLKMKIHFLDQALQRRSEDGVKELITENVQLKSDRVRSEKDNHTLRKAMRDLERKVNELQGAASDAEKQGAESDRSKSPTTEEELLYLRETVEVQEIEIEKLRSENIAKEGEKRRMAEVVKSMGEPRTGDSDVGSLEERGMWKDMLDAENAAREQANEENRRLREENAKLRHDAQTQNRPRWGRTPSVISRSNLSERDYDRNGNSSATSGTLVELERLKHENSELQKVVSAQVSTLTTRNREKDRLYVEIEELKLAQRNGGLSVAGDSIFERSASRARSHSRASNGTGMSRVSDHEKEALESKIEELRDQVSESKLENQKLANQLDEAVAELDAVDKQAQADADQFNEELHLMGLDRDDALRAAHEQEEAFQELKAEAQEEIDAMGDELDAKLDECQRLENDLKNQEENFNALQAEMRSATEGIVRLEEDAQANLSRYKSVQAELEDANREVETLEKSLADSNTKIQRLTVQQESSHNEIAFLREEQDADKIKIGDLESALKDTQSSLQTEKDRAKELDRRLAEERHQREVVGSREKQEVQRIMNDLNRQATAAADDVRKLKKALSSREIEAATYKERLVELENNLRSTLGDVNGNRASFITSITTIQKELNTTQQDFEETRRRLDESETTLASRDALLESSSFEYRKVADLLERERTNRKADKHSFEQTLKSAQASTRTISQNNSRISELEQARKSDRAKHSKALDEIKEQLNERNGILLTLWKRLSALCGPDWTHSNSLINGNLPSQEVVGNILFFPAFTRNLLLAAKQVEGSLATSKDKIKRIERDLWKEYSNLEHTLDARVKRLDRIEDSVSAIRQTQQQTSATTTVPNAKATLAEISKLKSENRLLKAELQLFQQPSSHNRPPSAHSASHVRHNLDGTTSTSGIPPRMSSTRGPSSNRSSGSHHSHSSAISATLMRHHSTNIVEHLASAQSPTSPLNSLNPNSAAWDAQPLPPGPPPSTSQGLRPPSSHDMATLTIPSSTNLPRDVERMHTRNELGSLAGVGEVGGRGGGGESKWIHRLRELERRLKAEREARLLDRNGARKRLEERGREVEGLREELERERERNGGGSAGVGSEGIGSEGEEL